MSDPELASIASISDADVFGRESIENFTFVQRSRQDVVQRSSQRA